VVFGCESEMFVYQTWDGQVEFDCQFIGDVLWLVRVRIAELFGCGSSGVILCYNKNMFVKAVFGQVCNVQNLFFLCLVKLVLFYGVVVRCV